MVKCVISSTELFSQRAQPISYSNSLPANMILQDQNEHQVRLTPQTKLHASEAHQIYVSNNNRKIQLLQHINFSLKERG
jgi:hypothetical protein